MLLSARTKRFLFALAIFISYFLLLRTCLFAEIIPPNAYKYKKELVSQTILLFGIESLEQNLVSLFAAQIHQESRWNPLAQSKYASGLSQFTPDTVNFISDLDSQLAMRDPFNVSWSIRALVVYDKWLFGRVDYAIFPLERWALVLAGYNGGLGWIQRERKLIQNKAYWWFTENEWFENIERVCIRRQSACSENRSYPRKILFTWRSLYQESGF